VPAFIVFIIQRAPLSTVSDDIRNYLFILNMRVWHWFSWESRLTVEINSKRDGVEGRKDLLVKKMSWFRKRWEILIPVSACVSICLQYILGRHIAVVVVEGASPAKHGLGCLAQHPSSFHQIIQKTHLYFTTLSLAFCHEGALYWSLLLIWMWLIGISYIVPYAMYKAVWVCIISSVFK